MIRVLLVNDQELVRTGLRGILRTQFGFDVVGECADGSEVIAAVELADARHRADGCADADGQRRAGDSRAAGPRRQPARAGPDHVRRRRGAGGRLAGGASGFILKGVPARDLQQAVRVVAEGGAWLDPAVTGRVLAIYRAAAPAPAGSDARLDTLTGREREVLALIGQGKTNAEIAAGLFVGEGTVKTHINHVFTKLQLRDRAAAVVYAFDHDLVSRAPDRRTGQAGPGG